MRLPSTVEHSLMGLLDQKNSLQSPMRQGWMLRPELSGSPRSEYSYCKAASRDLFSSLLPKASGNMQT